MTRTIVYIGGYNLYYSRLQGTPFKWLDVVALFRDQVLRQQNSSAVVVAIKYFTAHVKANCARYGPASEQAQTQYLRALMAHFSGLAEITLGFQIFQPTSLPVYVPDQMPSKDQRQRVWMIEEKLTDVQLALTVYRDALRGGVDQMLVCSNDSDVEPALKLVRQGAPDAQYVRIGWVMPLRLDAKGQGVVSNKRLNAQATWVSPPHPGR